MKSIQGKINQAAHGLCEGLRFDVVPAGAEALRGRPVKGATLTIAGTYEAHLDVSGVAAKLEIHLQANIVASTITSDVYATLQNRVTKKGASAVGVGALADDTLQSSSLDMTLHPGVQFVKVVLVVGAAPNITVDVAEANGI